MRLRFRSPSAGRVSVLNAWPETRAIVTRPFVGGCAHGIRAVIARKSNQRKGSRPFDKQSYRRRCVIEQCVGWLKECRRIGTRFEKLAISFLAMFKLAMIRRYLKLAFSDRA